MIVWGRLNIRPQLCYGSSQMNSRATAPTAGCLVLFLSTLFQPFAAPWAETSKTETPQPIVRQVVLENGLKVLLLENHKTPAVTFQVWYRVGSRDEVDGKSGLAHFLEHMLFKGTDQVGPEEYSRIITKNGGRFNAFTMNDATVYFATMSREKIGLEIDLEADRMVNARLDDTYFTPEKRVVQEERRMRIEDRPSEALDEATRAVTYTVHPYRRPVIGWMEDIANMTLDDLRSFYRTYYSPKNAFIVVAGDFSSDAILSRIEQTFGKISPGPEPPPLHHKEPPQRGERRVIVKKEAKLPMLLMYYHVPNVQHEDSYVLEVLEVILSSGRTSRLFRELVYDQRLARTADASYDRLSVDSTLFALTAQAMPGKDPKELERAIEGILEELRTELVSQNELEKAKNQLEASFVFAQDSNFGQAMRLGLYELTGGWEKMNAYLDGVKKVTAADIRRVVRKYFDPDQRTVGTLIPRGQSS